MISSHALQMSRRDLLSAAAGCTLSFLLPPLLGRAADERGPARAKSLITIWLGGGPSQLETWDPHPGTVIGGPTKAIETRLSGVQIGADYARTAEQIQHLSVVRSLVSQEGDHERGAYFLKTGYRPDPTTIHPSLGALLTQQVPSDSVEIPLYVSLLNSEFPGRGGYFGDEYDPFKVFDPGTALHNMEAPVDRSRLAKREQSLAVVEQSFLQGRKVLAKGTLHAETIRKARRMMDSTQLNAFKVEEEPAERKAAYGDTSFGRGCLVARRLVETGVRAVEVNLSSFDTHANNFEFHTGHAKTLDPALAALIQDLKERDLLASTIVLVLGEFGRTPKINPLDGRDHWPTGFSCLIGGGGLATGRVIGATDPTGEKTAPTDPVSIQDLFATIIAQFGINGAHEMMTPIGRPMKLCEGKPLAALLT